MLLLFIVTLTLLVLSRVNMFVYFKNEVALHGSEVPDTYVHTRNKASVKKAI